MTLKNKKTESDIYNEIIEFWFIESKDKWWIKNQEFDDLIKKKYAKIHSEIIQGKHKEWRMSAFGCLAEIIVLDQFSRNIYRDTPEAFSNDKEAVKLLDFVLKCGFQHELDIKYKPFIYMPLMHSESREDHVRAANYFNGYKGFHEFELKHKAIIDRFGRYPHRNKILGRDSTKEEIKFLKEPGSSF